MTTPVGVTSTVQCKLYVRACDPPLIMSSPTPLTYPPSLNSTFLCILVTDESNKVADSNDNLQPHPAE